MQYRTIIPTDPEYPQRLKLIHDPPDHLDILGEIKPEDDLALAVVGTRKFTSYGREVTEKIVGELVAAGLTIVSGLARGIDTIAHEVALNAGGRTIAVLGSGIKVIYPPENKELFDKITKNGAIVSEFPAEAEPAYFTFPRRNRIISGLCLGTLVIEGAQDSGTLITAKEALDQGREVFAVPGSIFSRVSFAPHELIRHGAHLIISAADILEILDIEARSKMQEAGRKFSDSEEERALLEILESGPKHIDELVRESGLSAASVGAVLAMMEIKGWVKNMGKQEYRGL